jgi:hypothetical protein
MNAPSPQQLAQGWLDRLAARAAGGMPLEASAPEDPTPLLAALCAEALMQGRTLLILVADDQLLPELSNSLDLSLRPLCLVLPAADFAARITMRATLSLLKSRMARGGEDLPTALRERQQARIAEHDADWQAALAWSAAEDRSTWPAGIGRLFPALILPTGRLAQLDMLPADYAVVLARDPLTPLAEACLATSRVLVLGAPPPHAPFLGALTIADRELQMRGELETVTREIAELELELATAQGELGEFTRRYHETVGQRMVELDSLQAELALQLAARAPSDGGSQDRADEAKQRAEQSRGEQSRFREVAAETAERFAPTQDVKKLFRQVAQKIHPDRARDEGDRHWRTRLMAEANRAYRNGDAHTLREVLSVWEEGRAIAELAPQGAAALEQQLERLRRRLMEIQDALDRLLGSRLYELLLAERMARRQGRDLLAEMSAQVDGQIADVRARLATLAAAS